MLSFVWRRLGGPLRWAVIWLLNAKFVVGVVGVIFNEWGEVLVQRHRYWPEGTWGLVSGLVQRGETLEAALAREVREETGYAIDTPRLLRVESGDGVRIEVHYWATISGGEQHMDPGEVLEARFCRPDALPAGLLTSHQALVALAVAARG